jgi:hypothetical protein
MFRYVGQAGSGPLMSNVRAPHQTIRQMSKRNAEKLKPVIAVGAVLAAAVCFAFAFFIANGVFFNHGASGTRGGPPGIWRAVEIDSIAVRVAGAVLFSAFGLFVLLRTFVRPKAQSKKKSQSNRTTKIE